MLNPIFEAFARSIESQKIFGQVLISKDGQGFALRHVADRDLAEVELTQRKPEEALALAQYATRGGFRPFKSWHNLARGWRMIVLDAQQLGIVLGYLYPGGLADWHA